jgi:hypothetical protein
MSHDDDDGDDDLNDDNDMVSFSCIIGHPENTSTIEP